MDAQRRHKLKDNTLVAGLEGLPGFYRRYGNHVLIAIIFLLLAFILIRSRLGGARDREEQARFSLSSARAFVSQLAQMPIERMQPQGVAATRQNIALEAERLVEDVLNHSKDAGIRAQAFLVRGDLDWRLANVPELPGADTQPALKYGKSSDDLLAAAEQAYREVLDGKPASGPDAVRSAWFGLAKIAENRRQWDAAKQFYQNVLSDPGVSEAVAGEATAALKTLEKIREPVYTGGPTTSIIMGPSFSLPELLPTPATNRDATTEGATSESPSTYPTTGAAPATQPGSTDAPNPQY